MNIPQKVFIFIYYEADEKSAELNDKVKLVGKIFCLNKNSHFYDL